MSHVGRPLSVSMRKLRWSIARQAQRILGAGRALGAARPQSEGSA
jgi:hypothetical protein